jgi:hypothetical protein
VLDSGLTAVLPLAQHAANRIRSRRVVVLPPV